MNKANNKNIIQLLLPVVQLARKTKFFQSPLIDKLYFLITNNFHKPDMVIIEGRKLYILKKNDIPSNSLVFHGVWEELETAVMKKIIKKGDVVVDIGAHIGYYTVLFSDLVGESGRVIAFEPDMANFTLLQKNIQVNHCRNVSAVNKAVTDRNGELKLFLANTNYGDHRIYASESNRKYIPIQGITLDTFNTKFPRINLIKMDVQGSEMMALRGMTQVLKQNKDIQLILEFWPYGLKQSGHSAKELLDFLRQQAFSLYRIDDRNKTVELVTPDILRNEYPDDDELAFTNLFCTRKATVPPLS